MNKFYLVTTKALLIVLIWSLTLSLFATYRAKVFSIHPTFPYYNSLLSYTNKEQAIWGHFDGAHYLKLASAGYIDSGTQAFFPVYPLMISSLSQLGVSVFWAGRLISALALVGSLVAIFYLFPKHAYLIIVVTLLFPTSLFLNSIYTESLFLFESLIFFILLKEKKYFGAAIIAGFASGTRLVGSLLALSLLLELWPRIRSQKILVLLFPLSLSGLFGYMYFLYHRFGDPLSFIHVQSMFGVNRSGGEVILLPQVIYRYLKIIFTVWPNSLLYFRALGELLTFFALSYALIKRWSQLPLSHSLYLLGSLLLPTLSGTLSSLPRYVLVLLPFLVPPVKIKWPIIILLFISSLLLGVLLSLFVSGQFVS